MRNLIFKLLVLELYAMLIILNKILNKKDNRNIGIYIGMKESNKYGL